MVRPGVVREAGYSLLMRSEDPIRPTLLRELIGESLREERVAQGRTLREVSKAAQVSLGYLSEVERGQKEASSELLAAICEALAIPMSELLTDAAETLRPVAAGATPMGLNHTELRLAPAYRRPLAPPDRGSRVANAA